MKTLDEVMQDVDAYHKTRRYKFDRVVYKVKHIVTAPLRWPYYIKWAHQRVNRGYSDRDMWSADMYLAGLYAGILQWYIDHGHGVSMLYAEGLDNYNPDVDVMVERRNEDYAKYIKIFQEYSQNGDAFDEEWQAKFGGVLDKDMQEALQWFSKRFSSLWD